MFTTDEFRRLIRVIPGVSIEMPSFKLVFTDGPRKLIPVAIIHVQK